MGEYAPHLISVLQDWVEQSFPGTVIPWNLLESLDGFDGFGVSTGSALTLVFIDSTEQPDWRWQVTIYSGLGVDIPNPLDALMWANQQNRTQFLGKYYIATNGENQAALICDSSIQGTHFEAAMLRNSGLLSELRGMVEGAVRWAEGDSTTILADMGGRPLHGREDDLMLLFQAARS